MSDPTDDAVGSSLDDGPRSFRPVRQRQHAVMPDDSALPLTELIATATAAATAARAHAYVPYSEFKMGAAVVAADGAVVQGVLVENVSLGLAMCAERVALFSSVTNGTRPAVLAVSSKRTDGELTFPCGACLQVALEIAGPDLTVVAVDPEGHTDHASLRSLLTRAPSRHHRFP
jgi:cytidine deaminase